MFSIAGIDLLEQVLPEDEHSLLEILLHNKTSKRNIIWATDDYAELREQYGFKLDTLIQPRMEKALELQTNRTYDKAEVFTPSYICNV